MTDLREQITEAVYFVAGSVMSRFQAAAVCQAILPLIEDRLSEKDAQVAHMRSWQGLMEFLDEHYPPEVFVGSSGDPGPRIVALTREVDRLRREVEFEANGKTYHYYAWNDDEPPPCACVTDEQAAQLGPGFSRPVCAVHPTEETPCT